ncbi:MAG TPA: hypothetical protein VF142_01920 [Longimicrobium sp.]
MRKVKLLLQDLHVESFAVQPHSLETGTVRGLELEGSAVHSECITHCLSACEQCVTWMPTHCETDCPSWDGSCQTDGDPDCGGTPIEA